MPTMNTDHRIQNIITAWLVVNLEQVGGCPKKHNPLLHSLEPEVGDGM